MAFSGFKGFCSWCRCCFSGCEKGDRGTKSKTIEAGEEVTETKATHQALTNQPTQGANQTTPPAVDSDSVSGTGVRSEESEKDQNKPPQESNNNTPVIAHEPIRYQAEIECLSDSYSDDLKDIVCEIPCTSQNLASTLHTTDTLSPIATEGESLCSNSENQEKEELLEEVNLILTDMMETVDNLVSDQSTMNKSPTIEEASPVSDILSSVVEQIQAPTEREATPEYDSGSGSGGSMHASTGSEGLEETLEREMVNGDKHVEEEVSIKGSKTDPSNKSEQKTKEKSKEDKTGKSKKKEDKTIDHILRALSSLQTTEEKLAALCKKYADLHEEHRIIQATHKQNQRKLTVVTREKDQLQSEHTKAVMAKSKLESLCRELQKHNQVIRQESLQRAREEDEKRKEISNKFQTTITEIQQQMTDHHDRNMKLREENQELAGKLKKFIEQYEVREKQVEKVMQHRELEQKLADAKLQEANAILNQEQERNRKEKEVLLLQATESQKRATLLEAQLGMYKERYEEFQSTINKSNDMFMKFKTEMDKMTKRIKKLEKEGAAWKNKWEKANKALIDMAEEKSLYDKEKPRMMNKIQKLESLCRAMQAERLGRKVLEASSIDMSKLEGDSSDTLPSETDSTPKATETTPGSEVTEGKTNDADSCDTSESPTAELTESKSEDNCECGKEEESTTDEPSENVTNGKQTEEPSSQPSANASEASDENKKGADTNEDSAKPDGTVQT